MTKLKYSNLDIYIYSLTAEADRDLNMIMTSFSISSSQRKLLHSKCLRMRFFNLELETSFKQTISMKKATDPQSGIINIRLNSHLQFL